jgi:hypothetical protein
VPGPTDLVASVPPTLDAIDRQALALAPADRFPSARTMAEALDVFLAGSVVGAGDGTTAGTAIAGAVAGAATVGAAAAAAGAAGGVTEAGATSGATTPGAATPCRSRTPRRTPAHPAVDVPDNALEWQPGWNCRPGRRAGRRD